MISNRNIRIILSIIGLIIIGYVVWNVRTIIYYFFAAAIVAFVARPLIKLMSRVKIGGKPLPNWLKSASVLVLFVLILIGGFKLIIPTAVHQAQIISNIDTDNLLDRIQPQITSVTDWMQKANIDQDELQEILRNELSTIFSSADIGIYLRNILDGLTGSLVGVFSILFISFFLIKDGNIVNNVVSSLSPDKYLEKIKTIIDETKDLLSRYFVGVLIQITIVMTIITIGLMILGVENALLIGVIAGVFNIIPYVGPLLGGAVGISLAITSQLEIHPDLDLTAFGLLALIPFVAAQTLDNFVLQPLIFSKSVKAHPLEIFLVILAAGSLGGVVGMIVAVPAYSFIRIVAKEFFAGYKVVQGLTKDL